MYAICATISVLQVPRQDQHVVGPRLANALGRKDRDVGARQELPVLVGVAVDGVVEEVACGSRSS